MSGFCAFRRSITRGTRSSSFLKCSTFHETSVNALAMCVSSVVRRTDYRPWELASRDLGLATRDLRLVTSDLLGRARRVGTRVGDVPHAEGLERHRVGLDEFDAGAVADRSIRRFGNRPGHDTLQPHFILGIEQ